MLYPMKFMPLFKNKVWGGNKIKTLGFDYDPLPNCGEMWVLSSVEGNESVIDNGFLEGNTLNEAIEIYMGDLVGERNYDRYGNEFPLLLKVIDAADRLSIQVHPDDELARQRNMENGKTEMWYVMEAEEGGVITDGFAKALSREEYQTLISEGRIEEALHTEQATAGDVFFIPAGRVHAIGKGIMLAEIQQSSDCTYRIYDYNRPDANGRLRELHTDEALDAIDFKPVSDAKSHYTYRNNATTNVAECPYFTTNLIAFDNPLRKDFATLESFVVYFCVEGVMAIKCLDEIVPLHAGECVLVPAVADSVELFCEGHAKTLEIYADPDLMPDDGVTHRFDNDWIAEFMGMQRSMLDDADLHHHHHDCDCGHDHHHDCDCGHDHHHDCDCGHDHHHD
ncbi:MAG: class I mannose-6-phosphate isomerase [Bacteroidales bacterium]|nr:class I mannose-6-phosphate isomerase [Bacteroidales bacterium]